METKKYTRSEFLTYLAEYQNQMMSGNQSIFMLIYMALQVQADTTICLRRGDFHWLCSDLQLDSQELSFIEIDEKVTIQKSMI